MIRLAPALYTPYTRNGAAQNPATFLAFDLDLPRGPRPKNKSLPTTQGRAYTLSRPETTTLLYHSAWHVLLPKRVTPDTQMPPDWIQAHHGCNAPSSTAIHYSIGTSSFWDTPHRLAYPFDVAATLATAGLIWCNRTHPHHDATGLPMVKTTVFSIRYCVLYMRINNIDRGSSHVQAASTLTDNNLTLKNPRIPQLP